MSDFSDGIGALTRIDFDKVLDVASSRVPRECWGEAWRALQSGKTVLEDESRLDRYLVAYGEMHRAKLMYFLPHTVKPEEFADSGVSVVDWGCGQGLATAVFLDYVRSRAPGVEVRASRLIEMSNAARARALAIVSKYDNVRDVREIAWLPGKAISGGDLDLPDGVPVVHLFSNILDVEAVDLEMVRMALEGTRSAGPAIVLTVGVANGQARLEAFWSMLGRPAVMCSLAQRVHVAGRITRLNGCSCFGISYRLDRVTPNVPALPASEPSRTPPRRPGRYTRVFAPGYSTSVIFRFARRHPEWCAYEFSTPDDSLLYNVNMDDVAPFHAVLNNLMVRGRPSFAPLCVEDDLARRVGVTERYDDEFGGIRFRRTKNAPGKVEMVESLKRIDPASGRGSPSDLDVKMRMLAVVPPMVARVQHAVMRGFIGGRFDGCGDTIRLLAVERDVPCVQLAMKSLEEMSGNLAALCREGERGAGRMKFEVTVVALDRTYDSFRDEGSYSEELDDSLRSGVYDAAIDVAFFHDPDDEPVLDELVAAPGYVARLRTAFNVSERDCKFQVCTAANIEYRPLLSMSADGTASMEPCVANLRFFLGDIFRKADFRDGQIPILDRALRCRSVIGLLPTGGGKSLTYQLAAMLQPGIALVVDPLQSLMKDQVDGLNRIGIDACQYINATLKGAAAEEAIGRTTSGNCKFIFISPERLSIPSYRQVLGEMYANGLYFSYGVIDEVHCVSEWGHDFRPFYLHLGRNLHDYARVKDSLDAEGRSTKYIPMFGLTATASFDVLSDVQRELAGRNADELEADAIVRYENTNRLELQYRVVKVFNPDGGRFAESVMGLERRVRELKAQARREWQDIQAGNADAGKKAIYRGHLLEIEAQEEGAPGRQTLRSEKSKFSRYAGQCKLDIIEDVLCGQDELFDELMKPSSIDFIKRKFLEREEIRPESPLYEKVMDADLSVDFCMDSWAKPDPAKKTYGGAGLVFCPYKGSFSTDGSDRRGPSPLSVEGVYAKLRESYGETVRHFTSAIEGNAEFERRRWESQQQFVESKAGLMVATSAFGMGIDKPNIRFVVEINHPVSLESFVQEAGRAGRDRKMAVATLLLSEASQTDMDVTEFFHKKSFIGIKPEKKELVDLFDKRPFEREQTSTAEEGRIYGFLEELLSAKVGEVRIFQIDVPKTPQAGNGVGRSGRDRGADPKSLLDKLVYRLCCIGVIDDVECLYGDGGSRYRLTMVRRDEEDYYAELGKFLMRYYPRERADREVELARGRKGANAIHRCVGYLTEFVYGNIERKRARAMQDMHAFCKEGCRPLRRKPDGSMETWLDVNEDLKDWIYFYFNSKYARSGYEVKIGDRTEPYSLVDDTDHGKKYGIALVGKYMRVVDDELLENNSPKDNVKHLQGAVRLIRRAAMETNPVLSLLNVFCLCYLGFRGNDSLVEECVRSLGVDGIGTLISEGGMKSAKAWRFFDEFVASVADKAPTPEWDEIVEAARLEVHAAALEKLIERLS